MLRAFVISFLLALLAASVCADAAQDPLLRDPRLNKRLSHALRNLSAEDVVKQLQQETGVRMRISPDVARDGSTGYDFASGLPARMIMWMMVADSREKWAVVTESGKPVYQLIFTPEGKAARKREKERDRMAAENLRERQTNPWYLIDRPSAFVQGAYTAQFPKHAAARNTEMTAGFVPYHSDVVAGEPVVVTFCVNNVGKHALVMGYNLGSGRSSFNIYVRDKSGQVVRKMDAQTWPDNRYVTIKPGKSHYTSLVIPYQADPLPPGEYQIICERLHREQEADSKAPGIPKVSSRFAITVRPADPAALGKAVERFGDVLKQSLTVPKGQRVCSADAYTATLALQAIRDERTVPYLLQALRHPASDLEWYAGYVEEGAAQGLAKYQTVSLDPLQMMLHDSDTQARGIAARALGWFQKGPEVSSALLSALDDSDIGVRRTAIENLAVVGDGNAAAKIRPFLNSTDEGTVFSAIRTLKQLGETPELSWYDPIFGCRPYSNLINDAADDVATIWGDKALPYLASRLDLTNPTNSSHYNSVIIAKISRVSRKKFDYRSNPESHSLADDEAHNLATMRAIQAKWPL